MSDQNILCNCLYSVGGADYICTMGVNHPGVHNGQGMSWPQVIWSENKLGAKCGNVYATSPQGGYICRLPPDHKGPHEGQGKSWTHEGVREPDFPCNLICPEGDGKGFTCELVKGHQFSHSGGGHGWKNEEIQCGSTYKRGDLVPNPIQCELRAGHTECHKARSIVWTDTQPVLSSVPRCRAQYEQPGKIVGCLLQFGHEGDHKNGDLSWFNPRGAPTRPNQCKSEINGGGKVHRCQLDVGHKGSHSNEEKNWERLRYEKLDGPCTSSFGGGSKGTVFNCQLGLHHPDLHQYLSLQWTDQEAAWRQCGVSETDDEDSLKCSEEKGHVGNHCRGIVWWRKDESDKTGYGKRKHNMSLKLVELPTWKGKVVLYNDTNRWWMMVVDTTAANVQKYEWEVFFDYKQLDVPHVRDMQEAIWNSLPDIDKEMETSICAKAISGALRAFNNLGAALPGERYGGMTAEQVIEGILQKGFELPRINNNDKT